MSSPAGRSPRTWFTRACTCCSATTMSVRRRERDVRSRSPPRIDRDCTRVTPGTMLTASSIGRVTLNSTCRAPSDVPCTTIVMRENCELGIDRRRQPQRRPDAGRAEQRDRQVDEAALLGASDRATTIVASRSSARRRRPARWRGRATLRAVLDAVRAVRHDALAAARAPRGSRPSSRVRAPTFTGRACAMLARVHDEHLEPSPSGTSASSGTDDGARLRRRRRSRPNTVSPMRSGRRRRRHAHADRTPRVAESTRRRDRRTRSVAERLAARLLPADQRRRGARAGRAPPRVGVTVKHDVERRRIGDLDERLVHVHRGAEHGGQPRHDAVDRRAQHRELLRAARGRPRRLAPARDPPRPAPHPSAADAFAFSRSARSYACCGGAQRRLRARSPPRRTPPARTPRAASPAATRCPSRHVHARHARRREARRARRIPRAAPRPMPIAESACVNGSTRRLRRRARRRQACGPCSASASRLAALLLRARRQEQRQRRTARRRIERCPARTKRVMATGSSLGRARAARLARSAMRRSSRRCTGCSTSRALRRASSTAGERGGALARTPSASVAATRCARDAPSSLSPRERARSELFALAATLDQPLACVAAARPPAPRGRGRRSAVAFAIGAASSG